MSCCIITLNEGFSGVSFLSLGMGSLIKFCIICNKKRSNSKVLYFLNGDERQTDLDYGVWSWTGGSFLNSIFLYFPSIL